ncbi:MAG: OmpA family protein [Bdellovibrionales bacterium]|nr:OmpA family protein [Bdellovibrionales bacterium]
MSYDEHDNESSSNDRWLVSYADFMTLMFAFFAVLFATSQKDMDKAREFQDSVKRYLIKAGAFGESGAQVNQGQRMDSPIEQPIPSFRPDKKEAATQQDDAEEFIASKLSKAEREKYILDLQSDEMGVRITLPASALFSAQSERFREDAVPFLGKLSELLGQSKRKILIEGHVSPGEMGSFKSTWDFSSARAVNALRFMQKRQNLASDHLVAATLADSRPLFKGQEKAALNSRLEIVLLNEDSGF